MGFFNPKPAPPGFAADQLLPEPTAPLFSRLFFLWVSPLLNAGFSRPLEKDDLWRLPQDREADTITTNLQRNFYARCPPEKRPSFLTGSTVTPDSQSDLTKKESDIEAHPEKPTTKAPKYDGSLVKAINRTYFNHIWGSGLLRLCGELLYTTSPLVTRLLLSWTVKSYVYHRLPEDVKASGAVERPQGVGYGIGLAFALYSMLQTASFLNNHYNQLATTTGLSIRSALVGVIFRKSLRLSGRARIEHTSGKITNMISSDATRIDRFASMGHLAWIAPIQILLGIGLLIRNLGYSALVGVAVIVFGFPLQFVFVRKMFAYFGRSMQFTDKRVRLLSEILQGIRLIKFYAWEDFYHQKVTELRKPEIQSLRALTAYRAILIGIVICIPVLAAVLSFITYALTGHELDVAIIFSSLQLFNIIRAPLLFFPMVLNLLAETFVALGRISVYLVAEDLPQQAAIDQDSAHAISVDGDFTWETVLEDAKKSDKETKAQKKERKAKEHLKKKEKEVISEKEVLPTSVTPTPSADDEQEQPFALEGLKLKVDRGAFVAIVGTVGSGKSSILQALIGEMRKTRGNASLGASVAYVPQTAWIKNATLRENILFGQPDDEKRFRDVVEACSLTHDLEVLPQGERTEIGEKGINLSGGQRARVSLARAVYSTADIILMDDPLSAVDAHVGKAILDNCLLSGPLASRTRVLVTHALHVLDRTDYIYVVDKGKILEQGTYSDLLNSGQLFSRLMQEYGTGDEETVQGGQPTAEMTVTAEVEKISPEGAGPSQMQDEERNTGAVSWATYRGFFVHGGGLFWLPFILFVLILGQANQVANVLFLGFWTSRSIPGFTQGEYMGVYAALGAAQGLFGFVQTYVFSIVALNSSYNFSLRAVRSVLATPVAFFDTTPLGRVMSRLSKDQDSIDRELVLTISTLMMTASMMVGTIGLVFYVFPYLGLIFIPLGLLYYIVAKYYRRTSVETKRLDSVLRSILYASFSESLTGLATIRAYREEDTCIKGAEHGLNMENRAYYMTLSVQSWLGLRLQSMGNVLALGVALFAVGFRHSVDPSKIGIVLTYALGITQIFADMVSQFAVTEQNMNAVERLLVYSELPSEGDPEPKTIPPTSWPEKGQISFKDVEFRYRPELPLVLKGISFDVQPGEKVGIVGRTGAGKSSLLQALFRIVELSAGGIEIDGIQIRDLNLQTLRRSLALVPQESTLFMGTLRDNLDPQRTRTDAELITALQRAWLLPKDGPVDPAVEAKFSLDSVVGDDGTNFSAGEKQLLALCRALVKNSRIIVLDEATSSVDVETDSKLQQTIQTEFSASTLLCIAHRINTIAYYDRVLVMDGGKVAEYDTVLNLYDRQDSIFRSLCDEANLKRMDIVHIRETYRKILED